MEPIHGLSIAQLLVIFLKMDAQKDDVLKDTTSFKSMFYAIRIPLIQINPLPYSHATSYGHCVFLLDRSYASMNLDGFT